MTVAASPPTDGVLIAPLMRVRGLLRLRAALAIALAAIVALLGALLAARLLGRVGLADGPAPLIVLAALGGGAVAGWAALQRRRTTREIALEIDRSEGLDYRYATAVDLALDREEPVPLVARVLVADAEAEARRLRPGALVSFRTPALVTAAAAAVLLAGAVALVPAAVEPEEAIAVAEQATGSEEVLLETLAAVAEQLAEDAETRDDPYLTAVASALRERIAEAHEAPGDPDLGGDAAALLDHAAAAYGGDRPDWLGPDGASRLPGLQARLDEFAAAEAREAANPELGPTVTQGDFDYYGDSPGENERRAMAANQAVELAQSPGGAPSAAVEEMAGGPTDGIRKMDFSAPAPGAGVPVGAALNSGRGLSNAAGLGSETLEADDAFTALGAAPGQDMVLTAKPSESGNRIRIELAPEASELAQPGAAGVLAASSDAGPGEPGDREFVSADRRQVVARYFARNGQ